MINETLEVIARRRSVRQFSEQPVSDADIAIMLEAANKAPSAHNQQSWRFFVIKGNKKQALADLVAEKAPQFPRPSYALLRMASRTLVGAPVVIGIANTGELVRHGRELFAMDNEPVVDFFRTMEIQSSAAAVENLLLAATSMGLGSVWLGILYLIKDDVLALLGEPQGEFMAVVPIGYPLREGTGPAKRPLEKIIKRLD
ncbi:MAG: nitroreductase family protein [Fibrobacterota bacterium]